MSGRDLRTAELYDPTTDSWSPAGSTAVPRYRHSATLLPHGMVLVTGGYSRRPPVASAELFDPYSLDWSLVAGMEFRRADHTAVGLLDGTVLVLGGTLPTTPEASAPFAQLYDPASNEWSRKESDASGTAHRDGVLLEDGRILVTGGFVRLATLYNTDGGRVRETFPIAEAYDPSTGEWEFAGYRAARRSDRPLVLSPNPPKEGVGSVS